MRLLVLVAWVCLVLVNECHGMYSDEETLLDELEAMAEEEAIKEHMLQTDVQGHEKKYDNQFDKPLSVECDRRKGEALYKVNSRYSNYKKDRQWKWECRKVGATPLDNCKWTAEINDLQDTVRFMCPKNKFISGLKSKHYNKKEDRRWRVMCCEVKGYHTEGCLMTRKLNQYKEAFSYTADKGTDSNSGVGVFVGLESDFKRPKNDRRWQLTECTIVKDGKSTSEKNDKPCSKDNDKEKSKQTKEKEPKQDCGCDNETEKSVSKKKSRSKSRAATKPCDKG